MTTFAGPPLDAFDGIGALTLGAFIEEVAATYGDGEALVFDDPLLGGRTMRWSYADLRAEARRIGRSLVALGTGPGTAVGVLMGNRPEAVAALFGAAMAGAVVVPLSTFAPRPELEAMLDRAGVTVALTQDRLLARRFGADLDATHPALDHLAVLGTGSWGDLLARSEEVGEDALDERIAPARPDDPALVIFSSGTTGVAKGIVHGHRAPTLQFWIQAQVFGRHHATRMWSVLPLFWTAGLTAMGATLAAGGCWVMQETFDPGGALALMSRERVTEPYTLPHQAAALEEHPDWPTTDLSSLTCVYGTSSFSRHPAVKGDTGWRMPVGYGLSETCASFASHWWNAPRQHSRRSMGRLLPGNQLRVIDPVRGRPVGVGETGELAVKGPTLMQGYLGVTPADCVDGDGFFLTADTGFVDAEGELHYSGRRTEMIKTGGANVSPAEIEVQLRACPPVKVSRVVGVPDPLLGQLVVACITLKDGASSTADEIRSFLRDRLAAYQVPKRVLFFADGEIPMTGGGTKVRDEELLALVHDRLDAGPVPIEVH